MTGLLTDAFAHHTWATLTLLDTCDALSPEQLETTVPGTFGSIIKTMQHTVGSDSYYLWRLGGLDEPIPDGDEERMDLAALRRATERHAEAWPRVLAADPDPDAMVVVRRDDGSEYHAVKGVRLAQALHHGTDHRSQIATALTSLGIEPPGIDVWDYAQANGRAREIAATS